MSKMVKTPKEPKLPLPWAYGLPYPCRVMNCKRQAESLWQPLMANKPSLPVCEYHQKRRLWWHKGQIFDRDEEL
jgi:hypothetical protein